MAAKPSLPPKANATPARGTPAPAANGVNGHKRAKSEAKAEPKILFQKYFKSVGPRTYAAQVKQASNGNHFLVLTEGKRDFVTNEVRKLKLFVFSEDFAAYFRMLHEIAQFMKTHPVSPEIKMRRMRYWAKKEADAATAARMAAEAQQAAAAKQARPMKPTALKATPVKPTKVTPLKATAKSASRRPARGR